MVALTRSMISPRNSAEPKYLTPRTPSRPTFGHETVAVAEALGQPPMPWQQHWMLVTGELVRDEETGVWVPAYPEAFATMMRQNGKTLWVLSAQLQRATVWEAYDGKPQALAYSGQTGLMARQKFRKEHWPMIRHSEMRAAVSRPRFDAGDTGIDFKNGSILTIWGSSEDAGHSLTVDQVAMDEIWADVDDRREQAALPAMATRHDRQKILASTGGTEKSVLYLRKQSAGRAAVSEGRTDGMAYLEFAFDPDDDPEDPKTWWANMPALGYTITERTVQAALDEMRGPDGDLSEFRRAWGNVTRRKGGDRVIPVELWDAVLRDAPLGRVTSVAIDAAPDLASASIAVASPGVVEVNKHDAKSSWLVDEAEKASKKLKVPVVVDRGGPVSHVGVELEARGVDVVWFTARELAQSSAVFYERVADGKLAVRPTFCSHCDRVAISTAVEHAVRKPLQSDGWKWSRKTEDVDVSPLVAATLAVGLASGVGADPERTTVPFAFA